MNPLNPQAVLFGLMMVLLVVGLFRLQSHERRSMVVDVLPLWFVNRFGLDDQPAPVARLRRLCRVDIPMPASLRRSRRSRTAVQLIVHAPVVQANTPSTRDITKGLTEKQETVIEKLLTLGAGIDELVTLLGGTRAVRWQQVKAVRESMATARLAAVVATPGPVPPMEPMPLADTA